MKASGYEDHESAFSRFLRGLFAPIMNDRGEVNVDLGDGDGGEAAGGEETGGEGEEAAGGEGQEGSEAGAEAAGGEGGEEGAEAGEEATDAEAAAKAEADAAAAAEAAREAHPEVAQLKAEVERLTNVANFFQQQFNERFGQQHGASGQQGQAQGAQPGTGQQRQSGQQAQQQAGQQADELPPGIVKPGEWESQDDEAKYVDHIVGKRVAENVDQIIQSQIQPELQRTAAALGEQSYLLTKLDWVLGQIAKPEMLAQFDAHIDTVKQGLFVYSPDGKVVGVKDPARLEYFKAQKNPIKAMLDDAMRAAAPQLIKQGVVKSTKALIKKVTAQKKGPPMPAQRGTAGKTNPAGPPPFNASKAEKEKYLADQGLIG